MGRSEAALVQDMYDGVKAMIDAEKELSGANKQPEKPAEEAKGGEGPNVGDFLKSPDDLKSFPIFPQGTKSLLSKCLT